MGCGARLCKELQCCAAHPMSMLFKEEDARMVSILIY
jgi:hypothetical protein